MESHSADLVDTMVVVTSNIAASEEVLDVTPNKRLCTSQQQPLIDLESADYNMNHEKRGLAIVFNHFKFDSEKFKIEPTNKRRYGTEKDRNRLEETFKSLDFDVHVHNDCSRQEIAKVLQNAADMDHHDNDCIVVTVLSHGKEGRLEASDGPYDIDEILQPILNSQSLIGKPKLFFIQACRGTKVDPGFIAAAKNHLHPSLSGADMIDCTEFSLQHFKIPSTADLLVMYATYEGYFAWRNPDLGSCFIQALCDEFVANGTKDDLLRLLTTVNRKVAFRFQSYVPENLKRHSMKQMPSIVSMLTKSLKFTEKGQKSDNPTTSTD